MKTLDYSGQQRPDGDFAGKDLNLSTFAEAYLHRADFKGASLRYADFARADLREADFTGADLYQAHFYEANIEGAIFGTSLQEAKSVPTQKFRVCLVREITVLVDAVSQELAQEEALNQQCEEDWEVETVTLIS